MLLPQLAAVVPLIPRLARPYGLCPGLAGKANESEAVHAVRARPSRIRFTSASNSARVENVKHSSSLAFIPQSGQVFLSNRFGIVHVAPHSQQRNTIISHLQQAGRGRLTNSSTRRQAGFVTALHGPPVIVFSPLRLSSNSIPGKSSIYCLGPLRHQSPHRFPASNR